MLGSAELPTSPKNTFSLLSIVIAVLVALSSIPVEVKLATSNALTLFSKVAPVTVPSKPLPDLSYQTSVVADEPSYSATTPMYSITTSSISNH